VRFQEGGEEGNVQSCQHDGEEREEGDGEAVTTLDQGGEVRANAPWQASKKYHTALK
jgi:hypothetical protein